ncbi:hypothetical protein BVY01_02160 [bacterium I07]|nr:hypothetical protein BVY01_02160 [bacterium I07]
MFSIITFLFKVSFNLFKSKKQLSIQNCLQKKEIEILLRQNQKKRQNIHHSDRIIISILNKIENIKDNISIVKPETVLRWQRDLIKKFWTFNTNTRVGRPPVPDDIRQLILSMKNDNIYWGYKKIQGELIKLGIILDQKTIRNILADFCRRDKIRKSIAWKQFLKVQIHSIYAMDFFTIDPVLG